MNSIDWAQLWLAGSVSGALLLIWPAPQSPERREALRWVRYAAILACGLYMASPAFPLTAERAGWPWYVLDDLVVSIVLIWCIVNSGGGPKGSRSTVANADSVGGNVDITLKGGF